MELTMRTIVVMIILLVAALVFVTVMMGWEKDVQQWMADTFNPLKAVVSGA